jgi:hypothetical protein
MRSPLSGDGVEHGVVTGDADSVLHDSAELQRRGAEIIQDAQRHADLARQSWMHARIARAEARLAQAMARAAVALGQRRRTPAAGPPHR